jgi:hypothetical protein
MIRVRPQRRWPGFRSRGGRGLIADGVRANDPLEQEVIDQFGTEIVPAADVKGDCRQLCVAMERLSSTVDLIYIHFDWMRLISPRWRLRGSRSLMVQ